MSATFATRDATLSSEQQTKIDEFADSTARTAQLALLTGQRLPRVEVQGHGRRVGHRRFIDPPSTARADERAAAVKDAFESRIHRQQPAGLNASHIEPNVAPPGDGEGAGLAPQRADMRLVADDSPPSATIGGPGRDPQPIPPNLHMAWFGGAIPDASARNIKAWAERAQESGYNVTFHTDPAAQGNNSDLFEELGRLTGRDGQPTVRFSDDPGRDLNIAQNEGAKKLYDFAVEKELPTMQSDIVRYHALHQQGGVYIDSDVAPGSVDLNRPLPPMGTDSVPLLGPLLRDQEGLEKAELALAQLQQATGVPDAEMPGVAEYKFRQGQFGNHFIVAPKGSEFLDTVIKDMQLKDSYERAVPAPRTQLEGAARETANGVPASATGPNKINQLLLDHLGRQTGQPINKAFGEFVAGEWAVDSEAAKYFAGVQWITEDSSNVEKSAGR